MARDITAGLIAELGNPFTTPAYFVEIQFSTPVRFSSRGTLDWNGNTWESRDIALRGIGFEIGTGQQSGNLVMLDSDLSVTTLINAQNIAGRAINIWKFYGTAPGPDDPVQIFSGAGDAVSMDEASAGVNISLVQRSARELNCPRRFQTRANGFSLLPVSGSVIYFNGESFKLLRDRG